MQDRGAISEREAIDHICDRVPIRLHETVRDFICRQNRSIIPVSGMEGLLCSLKSAGKKLYLLSNTSKAFHRFRAGIPGIELFDDTLVSADVGLVKPDPVIFRLACEQFGIKPHESAFIDDAPINAEAAQCAGMRAYVFHGDVDELGKWLTEK